MDILFKSLFSAVITFLILMVAKYSSPKIAGAIGGLPIVFAISYILLIVSDKSLAKSFLIGGIYGALGAIFFSVVLLILNFYFLKNLWLNSIIAYILCFCFTLILVSYFSK